MTTFWSIYFGSSLALISTTLVAEVYSDFKRKQRRKDIDALLQQWEDEEADDDLEDED